MRARKSIKESPLGDRAAGDRSGRPARRPLGQRSQGPQRSSVTRWTLSPEIEAELAEVAAAAGCELIHAEWKGGVLRLVLDRPFSPDEPAAAPRAGERSDGPAEAAAAAALADNGNGGVTLADCEHVAKQASALLDVLDFGNGRYLLEVSSPGLDRQLYRPSDYQRFLGRLARVSFEAAVPAAAGLAGDIGGAGGTRRRTVVSRLAEVAPGTVTLADDRTGERLVLKLEDIRQARLEVEL